jgi:extradiol dioxygenase family protein
MNKRNILHLAARRGSVEILEIILAEMKKNKINPATKDINGDTALDIACIRGFDNNENETYEDKFFFPENPEGQRSRKTSKRFQVIKRLLDFRDNNGKAAFLINRDTLRDRMNTPLHWAIYWSDIDTAERVFCEFPGQLFYSNNEEQIPFDMCNMIAIKMMSLKSKLIVYYLLDDIYLFLLKNGMNEDIKPVQMSTTVESLEKRKKEIKHFDSLMTEKEVKAALKDILQNESDEKFQKLKKMYSEAKLEVLDHDSKVDIRKAYSRIPKYVQRISLWYAYFKLEEQYLELMKRFHCSPFAISTKGRSTIHQISFEKYHQQIMELILLPTYSIWQNPAKGFNLKNALNV